MLRNSISMMSYAIIILLSGIVFFSGCEQSQQTTTDPNMLVAEYSEDTQAMTDDLPAARWAGMPPD